MRIPNTIVVAGGIPQGWYFTSAEGTILRRGADKVTSDAVDAFFAKRKTTNSKVKVAYTAATLLTDDAPRRYYLTPKGCTEFRKLGVNGILQEHLQPRVQLQQDLVKETITSVVFSGHGVPIRLFAQDFTQFLYGKGKQDTWESPLRVNSKIFRAACVTTIGRILLHFNGLGYVCDHLHIHVKPDAANRVVVLGCDSHSLQIQSFRGQRANGPCYATHTGAQQSAGYNDENGCLVRLHEWGAPSTIVQDIDHARERERRGEGDREDGGRGEEEGCSLFPPSVPVAVLPKVPCLELGNFKLLSVYRREDDSVQSGSE